jgi:hypothetical protein
MINLLFSLSYAVELPGEELFVAQPQKKEVVREAERTIVESPQVEYSAPKGKSLTAVPKQVSGNLPTYLVQVKRIETPNSELIQKPSGSLEYYKNIQVGDSFDAYIEHSIIAFPDEKSPVVAQVIFGKHRGIKLIGESRLEQNSKRIFLNFDRLIIGNQIYKLLAQGVSSQGQPGLIGKYHSREAEFFAGDFISSFVAGYFDGLVPRKTNVFGEVQEDHSVDSAVKKGLASGALSSAERFREKLKKVPEFSEIKGPINLTILILDQPKRE